MARKLLSSNTDLSILRVYTKLIMFASSSSRLSNKLKKESNMVSYDSSKENNTTNLTDANTIKFTASTTIETDDNVWDNIKVIKI